MLRTTTLLIVMLLAGGPASSLVCELWCGGPAAEDHHRAIGCDDASSSAPERQQFAAVVGGCHDAVAASPFLTEERQTESGPAATDAAVLQLGSMAQDIDRVAAGWSVFQVQPLRGPSLHTVLRI